jgi:hypothetical protein
MPRWKAVLRLDCNQEELHEQELWDILADCTALQARRDTMLFTLPSGCESIYSTQADEACSIRDETFDMLNKLHVWQKQWNVMEGSTYFISPGGPHGHATTRPVNLPSSYQFAKDDTAKRLMLYNTTAIYILQMLLQLFRMPQCHGIGEWKPLPGHKACSSTAQYFEQLVASLFHAATEICRCVPHFMGRDVAVQKRSSPVVQWSISAAWSVLRDTETDERLWLEELMRSETGRFLARGLFDNER